MTADLRTGDVLPVDSVQYGLFAPEPPPARAAPVRVREYDRDAEADVYMAFFGTGGGTSRVLWRMSVADAMAICSRPETAGTGAYGGEWQLHWTCHEVAPVRETVFAADDGRFDDLLAELGCRVLHRISRAA